MYIKQYTETKNPYIAFQGEFHEFYLALTPLNTTTLFLHISTETYYETLHETLLKKPNQTIERNTNKKHQTMKNHNSKQKLNSIHREKTKHRQS